MAYMLVVRAICASRIHNFSLFLILFNILNFHFLNAFGIIIPRVLTHLSLIFDMGDECETI